MIDGLAGTLSSENMVYIPPCAPLVILNIVETVNTACEFETGQTCVAHHKFKAVVNNVFGAKTYSWSTNIGVITSSIDSETFSVDVDAAQDVILEVTLTVNDARNIPDTVTESFTSKHTLLSNCVTTGTDCDYIGYSKMGLLGAPFGAIAVEEVYTGDTIYAVKFNATEFIIQFGDNGDTQMDAVELITIGFNGVYYATHWDNVEKYYTSTDIDLLIDLATTFNSGNKVFCIEMEYLPSLVVYAELDPLITSDGTDGHTKGDRYFKNHIASVSPIYDGLAKASSHIFLDSGLNQTVDIPVPLEKKILFYDTPNREYTTDATTVAPSGRTTTLTGDGKIDVPINATLGNELLCNIAFADKGCQEYRGRPTVTYASGVMTIVRTDRNSPYAKQEVSCIVGRSYIAEVFGEAIGDANTGVRLEVFDSTAAVGLDEEGIEGVRRKLSVTFIATETTMIIKFVNQTNVTGKVCTFESPTCKEVLSVQGSVTYWDETTKSLEQVGADGVGSKELLVNGDFSDTDISNFIVTRGDLSVANDRAVLENPLGEVTYVRQEPDVLSLYRSYIASIDPINTEQGTAGSDPRYDARVDDTDSSFALNGGKYSFVPTTSTIFGIKIRDYNKVVGSTIYFDNISLKQTLPLSTTYTLKDTTVGIVCQLATNQFTQADLDALNAKPELLVGWYFGTATLPSGIVKGVDDKVYYPVDGYLLELTYSEGTEMLDNSDFTTDLAGWTQGGSEWTWENGKAKLNAISVRNFLYQSKLNNIGGMYRLNIVIDSISGSLKAEYGSDSYPSSNVFTQTKTAFFKADNVKRVNRPLIGNIEADTTALIDSISLKQITSEYLEIQGKHTQSNDSRYGVQDLRLDHNTAGVPTGVSTELPYTFKTSFSQVFVSDKIPTGADLVYLNDNVDALMDLWTGRMAHPTLSFDKSDFLSYFPCTDSVLEDFLTDAAGVSSTNLVTGFEMAGVTVTPITDGFNIKCTSVGTYQMDFLTSSLKDILSPVAQIGFTVTTKSGTLPTLVSNTSDAGVVPLNILLSEGAAVAPSVMWLSQDKARYGVRFDTVCEFDVTSLSIYAIPSVKIENYTPPCRLNLISEPYGATNLLVKRDLYGFIIGHAEDQKWEVGGYLTSLSFGSPLTNEGSLECVVSGMFHDLDANGDSLGTGSYRTEKRVLEWGGGLPSKYSINGVVQPYAPLTPNEGTLTLSDVALIGYRDKVTTVGTPNNTVEYYSETGQIIP